MILPESLQKLSKLRLLVVALSCIAAIVVGVSRITIVHEVAPVRTKVVHVAVPAQRARDGEMSDEQCQALKKDTSQTAVEDQFGLPKGGDPRDEENGWLNYPIRGHPDRICSLDFATDFDGKLDGVSLDLPLK